MHFIEELVVDEFLPTYRSMLAMSLREQGLTQSDVASLLGISQSAVSKYVHGEVERNDQLLEHRPLVELVERLAEGLSDGSVSSVQALVETEVFIRELERGGLLAQRHEAVMPELADYEGDFAVHDPDSHFREAERALSGVRRGIRLIENTSGFTTLIPAVGSNLVQALPDAAGVDDVAGVPGRIVDVKGRATIPADPEFGVSAHVASVLLATKRAGLDVSAAINIRYDESLIEKLQAAGNESVEFQSNGDVKRTIDRAIDGQSDVSVLYQTGDVGIEPIIYILGSDGPGVVDSVRTLLD